jgi:diadenosine tetraphosphatase ApaH/serine/threonine PP2A family protein phosphatase
VPDAWNAIMHVFDALCIAAVIENTILCLHGGLSPSLQRLEQLWLIDRFKEPPSEVPPPPCCRAYTHMLGRRCC